MGGLGNLLLISILIRAQDSASMMLKSIGITSATMFGKMQIAALGVGLVVAGIGVAAVKAATSFDMAMHKVYALTGISGAQMDWYKNKLIQMAPALDQTPTALAQGLYYVISAGHQGADALNILTYSAKAAAAGMTSMQEVADVLTSAINSFKTENLSAGHAIDDIMQAVVYGKIQLQQLSTGLSFVGVQASAAGFSFDETAAAISALSQEAGNRGARRVMMDLGNLFRQLGMRDIEAVLKKMPEVAKGFNLASYAGMSFIDKVKYLAQACGLSVQSLDQMRAAAHGNVQVFEQLALAHMHNSAQFLKLIGGAAAALPAFMLLQDKGKEYNYILQQMGGNGEKTALAFDKMRESTGQKWNMVMVAFQSILTVLGEQLLPVINKILDAFYGIGQVVLKFASTKAGIMAITTAFAGLAVVVLGLLGSIIGGMLGTATAGFIAAFGLIIAAGVAVGFALQAIVAHFGGMQKIMKDLQPLFNTISGALRAAGNEIKKAFASPEVQQALRQLQQALPQLIPLLEVLGVIIGAVVVVAFNILVGVIRGLAQALPGIMHIVSGLVMVLGSVGRIIKDIFSGNTNDLGNAFKALFSGLVTIVVGIFETLAGFIAGFFGHFADLFGVTGKGISKGWNEFWNNVGTTAQHAGQAMLAGLTYPFRRMGDLFGWLYNHNTIIKNLVDTIQKDLAAAQTIIIFFVNLVKMIFAKWGNEIKAIATQIWNGFLTPLRQVGAIIGGFVQNVIITPIKRQFQIMIGNAVSWGQQLIQMFIKGIQGMIPGVGRAAQGVFNAVKGWLGFHSPAPNAPESANWGPNMVKMFAQGITTEMHSATAAASSLVKAISTIMNTASMNAQMAGLGAAGAGASSSLASLASVVGGGTSNTTINAHFPNVNSSAEIQKAMLALQQRQYRSAQAPGGYGGVSPYTTLR